MAKVSIYSETIKKVLCYPDYSERCYFERLKELEELSVNYVLLEGKKLVYGIIPVLGKGYASIALKAITSNGKVVTLKIRRTDSRRKSMENEAICLAIANTVDVGPRLLGFTDNILMYTFIDGRPLSEWFSENIEPSVLKNTVRDVLKQCFRLDRAPLDHGELSRPHKHIIVDYENKPYIVDFESASCTRRPANLSSIVSFFFIRKNPISKTLKDVLKYDVDSILKSVKEYKRNISRETFLTVLRTLNLL